MNKKNENSKNIIIFSLVILIILIIIIISLFGYDDTSTDKSSEKSKGKISIDITNSNTYISPENEYDVIMSSIADEYQEAAEDINQNTSINADGTLTYYDDYMSSDYDILDINELREVSLKNNGLLKSDFEGTNLYCLLYYAISDIYAEENEEFTCNNINVDTIKPGFIYRCYITSASHAATILIDARNYKIHVENYN